MKNLIHSIYGILFFGLFIHCTSTEKPKNFDYGEVNNYIYTNNYFGCSIELPENWVIQSKEQTERLADMGKDMFTGDDKKLQAVMRASEINTANLLAVFQYELGSAVEYNPSMMILAENVMNAPGVKNGSDYLFQARRLLEQSEFHYDYLSKEFEKELINGTDFYKMDAHMNYMGLDIKQIYYSTIDNGFSFNLIVSYINDEQKNTLLESINSITFKK